MNECVTVADLSRIMLAFMFGFFVAALIILHVTRRP